MSQPPASPKPPLENTATTSAFPTRKFSSIKLEDSQPLTRRDLQYDLLSYLFNDSRRVFIDPLANPSGSKSNFRDLYVNCLLHSPKSSKVLKEKMVDVPQFGTDFAMLSFLSNVGRAGNNMAFFTEMKTALRTFHPVPALASTNGNLQDVPRMRLILKSIQLEREASGLPATLPDISAQLRQQNRPSTTIVNLLFVLVNHSSAISALHLHDFDFMSLFMPGPISSESRAQMLLWLFWHYLEGPANGIYEGTLKNPFSSPTSDLNEVPALVPLSSEEFALENVDSSEELIIKDKLISQRNAFLRAQAEKAGTDFIPVVPAKRPSPEEEALADAPKRRRNKRESTKDKGNDPVSTSKGKGKKTTTRESIGLHEFRSVQPRLEDYDDDGEFGLDVGLSSSHASYRASASIDNILEHPTPKPLQEHQPSFLRQEEYSTRSRPDQPTSSHFSEPGRSILYVPDAAPVLSSRQWARSPPSFQSRKRYKSPPRYDPVAQAGSRRRSASRTMLQQAWHVACRTDPLADSDEETDQFVRDDYSQRISIVNRLRGKEPTPEPEVVRRGPPKPPPPKTQRDPSKTSAPRQSKAMPSTQRTSK